MNRFLEAVPILGISSALFWGIILAVAAIVEISTFNLVSIWFVVAALVAMIAALLGASLPLQLVLFAVLSVAGFLVFMLLVRPRLEKRPVTPTNADRVLNQEGVVIETIDSLTGRGLVKVEGQTWSARLEGEGRIPEGALVRITGLRGVKVIVQALDGKAEKSTDK